MTAAVPEEVRSRADLSGIVIFLVVAFGAAWLICLPLWLDPRHLGAPAARVVLMIMMYAPALGVVAATLLRRRARSVSASAGTSPAGLGLRFGGSFVACIPYVVAAVVILPVAAVLAPFVGALFGLVQLDLVHFSGFAAGLRQATGGRVPAVPTGLLIMLQLLQIPVAAVIPNALLTVGEEIGWRGYLLPRLLPLGQWPALLTTGVVWGLWHTPVLLLGYNYPRHHLLGVPVMVGFTTVIGVLIGWLRLATGSIWPSVIAHGAVNASAGAVALFVRAGTGYDTALVGLTGVTGWILPILIIIVLALLGRLPVRNPR